MGSQVEGQNIRRGSDIPWGHNTISNGFDIPRVVGQKTIDRGSKYHKYRVEIPLARQGPGGSMS